MFCLEREAGTSTSGQMATLSPVLRIACAERTCGTHVPHSAHYTVVEKLVTTTGFCSRRRKAGCRPPCAAAAVCRGLAAGLPALLPRCAAVSFFPGGRGVVPLFWRGSGLPLRGLQLPGYLQSFLTSSGLLCRLQPLTILCNQKCLCQSMAPCVLAC